MAYSVFQHIRLMILFPDPRPEFFGPFVYSQFRMVALGSFLFVLGGVFVLGGADLLVKWKDPKFRKKTDWIAFVALAALAYILLSWPWWLLAAIILIPPLFVLDRRDIARLKNGHGLQG